MRCTRCYRRYAPIVMMSFRSFHLPQSILKHWMTFAGDKEVLVSIGQFTAVVASFVLLPLTTPVTNS